MGQSRLGPSPVRMRLAASMPFMRGMLISIRIRSNRRCWAAATPARPSSASVTSHPWRRSISRATRRLMALSSTIRMLRPGQSGLATACWGTVSGATGAGSRGSVIRNAVPLPGWLETVIFPPMASTRPLTMLRPSPVPSTLRSKVEPNVTNASKILSRSPAGMPIPVSVTRNVTCPGGPDVSTSTVICPFSVNLMALPTRFTTICSSRAASPRTGAISSPEYTAINWLPAACACVCRPRMAESTKLRRSTGFRARTN